MKKHYATRDFTDAGTERAFAKDEPIDATEGEIKNYVAAGLATDLAPTATKADGKTPA